MARGRIQWSAVEEAALRDGVTKYGVGKWRTILDDPDFSTVVKVRSNVDLKDKWRNMNLRKGEGRNSYKPVQQNFKKTSRNHNKSAALTIAQPEAPAIIHKSSEDGDSEKPTVMHQQSPQMIKVQQEMEYNLAYWERVKAAVDAELMRLRQMRPEDAAAAVAAFEKAEAAIAEAEEAERVAAEAERAAEEAQSVAEGLKRRLEEMKAKPGYAAPKRGKHGPWSR